MVCKKSVIILGSTGSIGTKAIRFILSHPEEFYIKALLAGSNVQLLQEQINILRPEFVGIADVGSASKLVLPEGTKLISGLEAGREIASITADIAISCVVGIAGLELALLALKSCARLATANKEAVVCGWSLMRAEAIKYQREIIPIDSEHSGFFQLLHQNSSNILMPEDMLNKPEKLTITCSGGPFLNLPIQEFAKIKPKDALKHPKWKMGNKISIDSATLANKVLEKIEAHNLFGFESNNIDIVVHPEAVIHAMIGFKDGSVLMQASYTDMIMPIAYALTFPHRMYTGMNMIDFSTIGNLSFMKVDKEKFRVMSWLDYLFADIDFLSIVFNAANEEAVRLFLENKISFLQIYDAIEYCLERVKKSPVNSLSDVLAIDALSRQRVLGFFSMGIIN